MAYGDSWRGRRGVEPEYGGSTPYDPAARNRTPPDDEAAARRSYSPADRGPGQPRGGHTEWGMGSPGGYGHSDPRVHRGSYGGYRRVGNRGDYSYDSGDADSYDFFGDQGNRVPSGYGGVTGPYAADFGSGYERSSTRGIARAGGPGRGSLFGMSGNYRGQEGGRFERNWYAPNYAGRGPRGYRRSDARIEEDVCEALTRDPDVDASDVEVHVTGGTVHLSGRVDDRESRWRSEDLAEQVSGVHQVLNDLRLRR